MTQVGQMKCTLAENSRIINDVLFISDIEKLFTCENGNGDTHMIKLAPHEHSDKAFYKDDIVVFFSEYFIIYILASILICKAIKVRH